MRLHDKEIAVFRVRTYTQFVVQMQQIRHHNFIKVLQENYLSKGRKTLKLSILYGIIPMFDVR